MRIGLIAGSGQFPIIFSKAAKSKGYDVYAVAHNKETDPGIAEVVNAVEWVHLGQIKRILNFFKKNDVHQAVMLGGITKTRMFSDIRPDLKAITLFATMKDSLDDGVLRGFADFLEKEGVEIKASTFLLPDLIAQGGCWTKRKPTRSERKDIEMGWRLAKEIGRLDIGQCVVVGGGSVLAVEAIDGTDATLRRGGKLGKGNAVAVKICKPEQDLRFDIPAVGAETIETMHESGVTALAVETGRAVVFDRDEMIALADAFGIAIVALDASGEFKG